MIFDNICNYECYKGNELVYEPLKNLYEYIFKKSTHTSYKISTFVTKTDKTIIYENHYKNIDIHFVLEGNEKIIITHKKDDGKLNLKYDIDKDCELFSDLISNSEVILSRNNFLVVYPGELHAPKLSVDSNNPETVKKIVIKVETDMRYK